MAWSPAKIKQLRNAYGETQEVFHRRIGVTVEALRFWEQGKGVPNGSAAMLLDRLKEDLDNGKIRPLPELATA